MWGYITKIPDRRLSILIARLVPISILVIFLPIVVVSNYFVISQGEKRFTELEVARAIKFLDNEVDSLDRYLRDWAFWDDTYQFGLDQNQDYIDNNNGFPMLLAARPILTSSYEGSASGPLIWIRLLDEKELAEFSELLRREMSISPIDRRANLPVDFFEPDRPEGNVVVQARTSRDIDGYTLLQDLNGESALVLQAENPRDLFLQGRATALVFSVLLLVLGFLLFGGTFHLTRSFLTSRRTGRIYLERFHTIVHQSREAILLVSDDCHILEANLSSRELLGWETEDDSSPCLRSLVRFDPNLNQDLINDICQTGRISEHHIFLRDGREKDIELSASPIITPGTTAYSLILRDVTTRKQAQNALLASEERYMLAAQGSNDGLWDWNLLTDEVYFSERWKAMLGYRGDEIQATSEEWLSRVHPDDLLSLRTHLSEHFHDRRENIEIEHRILHKNGQYRWVLARGIAVWNDSGYAYRIAGSLTDITIRKKLEEQLRFDALHDGLTGLGNRTLLIDHLSHVNERKKRHPELLFALFFLDLDRFKQVNDSLGHQAGDQLLIEVSQRLNAGLRTTDTISRFTGPETIARIAGDEFVILLEDFRASEDVEKVTKRVTDLLSQPFHISGQEIVLSASIGLVIPENAYANAEDIIRDADIAMYRAKQLGGGQTITFDQEMYQGTITRMQMEHDLRKAVERGEFEVYYQPIFTLANDRIAGFEALVRWNHPQRGLLLPGEFIPVAEEIGMIVPIGYFVMEEAFGQMQAWRNDLKITPELMISVNFSVRQILSPDLLKNVRTILNKTGFDPGKLWLEVTEGALLDSNDQVRSRLNELRSLGIRIEIDDFGTGYSSLSYLQNLPVDGFKIDRSFIKEIRCGEQQIVKSLIELGHSLGLTEVAEGVETEDQRDYLKNLSCQFAQGYLMSRPIKSEAIEELLSTMAPADFLVQSAN